MKYLFVVLLFVVPLAVQAVCSNKIDPSKVIIFVDTNQSELEIATAEKSACARGEKFVSIPKDYPIVETKKPSSFMGMMIKSSMKLSTKAALDDIRKSGGKLKSFIVSGHDGGGHFAGEKGRLTSQELLELMQEYKDVNDVSSALLLGCYTGVQKEIMKWRGIFPKIQLIGGYDGSAPLADRPQGHQYITELLTKESQLTSQADQKRLQNFTNANLRSLSGLNAAVFIQCDETLREEGYYFSSKHREDGFAKMDTKKCLDEAVISKLIADHAKYANGEVEPPKDTVNGEMRSIYNQARSLEHCLEITGKGVNASEAFNLLFYEGVKRNFSEFYKDDLVKVSEEFSKLDANEMIKAILEKNAAMEKKIKDAEEEVFLLNTPDLYLKKIAEDLLNIKKEKEALLNLPEFANFKTALTPDGQLDPTKMHLIRPADFDSYMKFNVVNNKENDLKNLASKKDNDLATALAEVKANKEQIIKLTKSDVDSNRSIVNELKTNPDFTKNLWVPNTENLTNKTRKELLLNVNQLNKVLSMPGLSSKQRSVLTWTNSILNRHLIHFRNPFSWHEYVGKVEAPEIYRRLSDLTDDCPGCGSGSGVGMGFFDSSRRPTVGGSGSGN